MDIRMAKFCEAIDESCVLKENFPLNNTKYTLKYFTHQVVTLLLVKSLNVLQNIIKSLQSSKITHFVEFWLLYL